jgi:hypothetical protein
VVSHRDKKIERDIISQIPTNDAAVLYDLTNTEDERCQKLFSVIQKLDKEKLVIQDTTRAGREDRNLKDVLKDLLKYFN